MYQSINIIDNIYRALHGPFCGALNRFFAGGVKGLMYLHSRGYTHMDVKPANFMTDKGMSRLKVGDLGFAGREFPGGWTPKYY